MSRIAELKVRIFADSADYDTVVRMAKNPLIKGFTTNPSLMRKAGVNVVYEAFARNILAAVPDRPVSFEVFADDFTGMVEQARTIASWGSNVNVKIPVTNTKGEFAGEVIRSLSSAGITVNVTAVFNLYAVGTSAPLFSGVARATNSYDLGESPYAVVVANDDAQVRAVREISVEVRSQLALFLRRKATES